MARRPTPHMVFEMEPHTTIQMALHMVPLCKMEFYSSYNGCFIIAYSLRMILTITVNKIRGRVFHYYLF
jgi:hypothetical protein